MPSRAGRLGSALDDGGGRLDAGLRLAGAGRRAPAQPRQLLAGQVAAGGLGPGRLLLPAGPALEVGAVAALVHVARAPIELEDAAGDPIEQVAVVGDQHQPAAERRPAGPPARRCRRCRGGWSARRAPAGRPRGRSPPRGCGPAPPAWPAARQRRHVGVEQVAHAEAVEHRRRLPVSAAPWPPPCPVTASMHGPVRQHRRLVERGDPHAPARAGRRRPRARPRPVSTRSRVDLPVPLSPTMPMRSPDDMVSDRSSNSGLPGRLADTRSRSTRITSAGYVTSIATRSGRGRPRPIPA